jgi:membrane protein DedA with SNARE-associated domain
MDSLVDFLLNFYGPTPYLIITGILLLCGLGIPVPEDILLFAGGLLSYYGITDVRLMILCCLFGVILGDSGIYFLGYHFGRKLTKKWIFHKLLPDDRLAAVQQRFRTRGNKLIFFARFMPGLRAPIFFSAGTLHLPYRVFLFYDGGAALISVPAIIGAVYLFGDELDRVVHVIQNIEHSLGILILGAIILIGAKWYVTHRKLKNERTQKA